MPGLLIVPSWYFTETNVNRRQGFVGWQVITHYVAGKKQVVGEIGQPVQPMDSNLGGQLELMLSWAAKKQNDGQWQKAESAKVTIVDETFVGADFPDGGAQFVSDEVRFVILPPGTMEQVHDEWRDIKAIAQG